MLKFFSIVIIIFIGFLLLFFKKRKFKNAIIFQKLFPNKLITTKNHNIKYISKSNNFAYRFESVKNSEFYRKTLRNKMFKLFEKDKEDKLKALKIAEELADKSTLPILRKGLRDISPEVIEFSALLIRKFK